MIPESSKSSISDIDEARNWFSNTYLKRFSNLRSENTLDILREPDWDNLQLINSKKSRNLNGDSHNLIVVPINYLNNKKPVYTAWTKETAFIEKLSQFYFHPIIELLIISKENEYDAKIFQVAYDRFSLKDNTLDFNQLTGYVLTADWENNTTFSAKFDSGKLLGVCDFRDKNLRTQNSCGVSEVGSYQTLSEENSDDELYYGGTFDDVIIRPKDTCYTTTNNNSTLDNILPGWRGGGGNYEHGGDSGGSGPYPPGYINPVPTVINYNLKEALCNPNGNDRWQMNENLKKTLEALNIMTGSQSVSNNMIEALVKSIGGINPGQKVVVPTILGKSMGVVTFTLGGVEALMGIMDGDISKDDMLNVLEFGAGVGAVVASGWLAVGYAGISLGIAIYQTHNTPRCN